MSTLRKALEGEDDGVRYIENVTSLGYCFVADRLARRVSGRIQPHGIG